MLGLPEKGMASSSNKHNCDYEFICDWIEASLLFERDRLSKSDVIDCLLENGIYKEQDFAKLLVDDAWKVVGDRFTLLGNPLGIRVGRESISKSGEWTDYPAYSFCMALSCSQLYPSWEAGCSDEFSTQGLLFERLSFESFTQLLPGWELKLIGWSPQNPGKLKDTVHEIISYLKEHPGSELDVHVSSYANEMGLDLLAYYSYKDQHANSLTMMVQCASGKNWKEKKRTPDLALWNKVVNFNSPPAKAFVMPFSFADRQSFRKETVSVQGMFIDRYRLLNPTGRSVDWVSKEVNDDLLDWLWPRVSSLPLEND